METRSIKWIFGIRNEMQCSQSDMDSSKAVNEPQKLSDGQELPAIYKERCKASCLGLGGRDKGQRCSSDSFIDGSSSWFPSCQLAFLSSKR